MQKFILLFRGSNIYQPGQSVDVQEAYKVKMMNWVGELIQKEIHVGSEPLEQTGAQVYGKLQTVIDKPFGKENQILGGTTIIQAKDIATAIEIVKTCPLLQTEANIEIRPIQSF
jgi:hypothetical protein